VPEVLRGAEPRGGKSFEKAGDAPPAGRDIYMAVNAKNWQELKKPNAL
jgi:hypothetical protein